MEGGWEDGEYVLFGELVVLSHGVEECFFVADEGVGGEMVGDEEGLGGGGGLDFGG